MADRETLKTPAHFDTFLNFPFQPVDDDFDADIAILGIPFGDPYAAIEITNDQTRAPTAVRHASKRIYQELNRYDFDLGGPLLDGRDVKVVDVGDVKTDVRDLSAHYRRAEEIVRTIVSKGAMPITIGGDHGIPIPVFRGLDVLGGPITIVQIDAHIDWRDDVNGAQEGYSSTIRRASEMEHIGDIFQIGLRTSGSARPEEVDAARRYGAHLIKAEEVFDEGIEAIIARIPDGGKYYLTIDADGLDPAVMPAVAKPSPGGLSYHHVRKVIHALARKGRLVGADIVEITPSEDVNDITCITAGHLIANMIGTTIRQNYFD